MKSNSASSNLVPGTVFKKGIPVYRWDRGPPSQSFLSCHPQPSNQRLAPQRKTESRGRLTQANIQEAIGDS